MYRNEPQSKQISTNFVEQLIFRFYRNKNENCPFLSFQLHCSNLKANAKQYSTVIKIYARFSRNQLRILTNIRDKSFLEFYLVRISVLLKFLRQKLIKLQIADFEQNWDFLPFFQFFTASSTLFRQVLCSINSHKSTEFIDVF